MSTIEELDALRAATSVAYDAWMDADTVRAARAARDRYKAARAAFVAALIRFTPQPSSRRSK